MQSTKNDPQGLHYGATSIPPDHKTHLVWVGWYDWRAREAFELQPGVLPLGEMWDLLPAAAVTPLAALQAQVDRQGLVALSTVSVADTVAQALRKAAPQHRP